MYLFTNVWDQGVSFLLEKNYLSLVQTQYRLPPFERCHWDNMFTKWKAWKLNHKNQFPKILHIQQSYQKSQEILPSCFPFLHIINFPQKHNSFWDWTFNPHPQKVHLRENKLLPSSIPVREVKAGKWKQSVLCQGSVAELSGQSQMSPTTEGLPSNQWWGEMMIWMCWDLIKIPFY